MRFAPAATPQAATLARRRGFWLRVSRERRGLTQSAAAEILGMSPKSVATIANWEAGRRSPPPTLLSRLAELYEVPMRLLLEPPPSAFEQLEEHLAHLEPEPLPMPAAATFGALRLEP